MRFRLAALLAAAALPLAGCGGSDSETGATGEDLAKLVPAEAPLYFEAVVRPDGDLRDDAEDALKKLLRTDDPAARLESLLDDASADSDVKWDDVKEWLGPRIGIFLTEVSEDSAVGAGIVEVTDTEKAKDALEKMAKEAGSDFQGEIVGDYAVIGTPEGVEAVKAVEEGGRPLSDVADFTAARDAVDAEDDLGLVYVDPQSLVDALAESGGADSPFGNPQALDVIRQVVAKAGRALAVGFHADGSTLRVDGATIGAPAGQTSTAASDSVAGLPADAWLAVGFGDLGTALSNGLAQIQQIAGAAGQDAPDFGALLEDFERQTGVNVEQDFLSWMGDGAIYARGRSIADIGAALTITTKDAAKSRQAVGILARGIQSAGATVREAKVDGYDVAVEVRDPQVPVSLFIAANDERFSLGVNPEALAAVDEPSETLGDSDAYGRAKEALGDLPPVAIIDTPTIINLLETFGLGEAPGYAMAKPYLDAIGTISVGTARDGDVSRFSFAVGLR